MEEGKKRVKVELNMTMRCNLRCFGCNRMCNRYTDRTEDMTTAQIQRFLDQARDTQPVHLVKMVGGEPLLHPQFPEIFWMLVDAIDKGIIQGVKVNSNGTVPRPPGIPRFTPGVRWIGKPPRKKRHAPYLWSPLDLGIKNRGGPCSMPRRCGFSLDMYGWLPCSAAIQIVRMNHWEHLYRDTIPSEVWAMDQLCPNCIHVLDGRGLAPSPRCSEKIPVELTQATPYWQHLIDTWDGKVNKELW
jgi:hypothetical protein